MKSEAVYAAMARLFIATYGKRLVADRECAETARQLEWRVACADRLPNVDDIGPIQNP
ncbi:hypothetical protein SPKIRA_21280 [Sphingomonas paucimobilis]|jgi:hypothetical protein|uniref:DNA, contig: SP622 n=1 Tax=Sphingomonas paucimobilis NBRC 13935 TaxID=1219050 RepID=A0A0C9NBD5_SPHPI|nr:hypothetical protein SPKIRA_21280 [Sphingomonas paucimobilis]GAN13577.1 hypothetical protein SP6_22_00090 [Sphingomonas paucimobilis NBRC 13935]